MKALSARDAKRHFREVLDSTRREPGVVNKNDRPVGVMIAIEDAANKVLVDFFVEKKTDYDEWLFSKVRGTIESVEFGKTSLREHSDAMTLMNGRLEARLSKSA